MKIAFIRHSSVSDEIIPPLHFGYLASCLPNDHEIKIYDQLRDNLTDKDLLDSLLIHPPDLIGLSAFTKDIEQVKSLAQKLKASLPSDTLIVLGGVQISLMPVETYQYLEGYIDYGFAGESEIAFAEFIEQVETNAKNINPENISNLVWNDLGRIIVNKIHIPENLDEMPLPRWDLMPPDSYPNAPHGAFMKQFPVAPIITTRGCAYSCTFCAASSLTGKKVRFRSLENIINEIKYLSNVFGVKEIHIEDDNFSISKSRVVEFSERLMKENLGITWAFPNGLRLNNLDLETLRLMKKAGCYAVNVGVESGNDNMLEKIKKKISRKTILEKISLVKEAGLDIGGFFIIGFPDETKDQINDTLDFARKLPLDRIGISYFQPYPGTAEYQKLQQKGEYHLDLGRSRHSLHTISYIPKSLTAGKLKQLRLKGFIRFYFRPRIFIKLINEIRSFQHFIYIFKRCLRWLSS